MMRVCVTAVCIVSIATSRGISSALTQKIGGIPAGVASVDVSDDAMSIVIRLSSPLSRAAKE